MKRKPTTHNRILRILCRDNPELRDALDRARNAYEWYQIIDQRIPGLNPTAPSYFVFTMDAEAL